MPTLVVKGKVVTVDGEPLDRKVVEVRPRLSVASYGTPATSLTDAGNYMATLTTTTAGGGSTFDVEVVVCELDTTEIGRSVLLCDVSGEITVDIVIGAQEYRGRSEYRRIEARISSFLGSTAVHELTAADIEYMARKLDVFPLHVAQYIHAARLAQLTGADVPSALYYGLLRQGFPSSFHELAAQGPEAHARGFSDSIASNIISDPGEQIREDAVTALAAAAASSAVWAHPSEPATKSRLRALLDTASGTEVAPSKQLLFIEKYLAHSGTTEQFWSAVEADAALGSSVRATYQWTLQINALANGYMPLIEALQAKREDVNDSINDFADLAALDVDDWIALLSDDQNGPAIGAPPEIPAEWSEEDRIQRYAETLERIIADTYPTRVVHKRIARDHDQNPSEIAGSADLLQFFTDNPGFELVEHNLSAYLTANPGALDNVADSTVTRTNLAKLQRIAQIVPRGRHYQALKPLYLAGLDSATAIDRMGERSFLRKHAASLGGEDVARVIYKSAAHVSALTLSLAAQYSPAFNKIPLPFLNKNLAQVPPEHADLETLFGNLDFCACEHCRSVYSPAAYFVDLLHFLDNQPGKLANQVALQALTSRRPNLRHIELSCVNTNTELPYIDLVNELLEYHVAGYEQPPALPGNEFWQTTWRAEELALRPEHQLPQAYELTAEAVYPLSLPFDLAFAETTLFHQSFDVSRAQLLRSFPSNDADWSNRIARAELGLDHKTWRVIVGAAELTEIPRDFWAASGDTWWVPLRTVSTLLARANLSLPELSTLLRTRFIGRNGLEITYASPPDDCNLDAAVLSALNASDLDKLHRCLRLQHKLGWSTYELDSAIFHLGGVSAELDALLVRKLAALHRLTARLKLSILAILPLWSSLDCRTPSHDTALRSFYADRFLSRVIDDQGSARFALNVGQTALVDTIDGLTHSARMATVQAALGISGEQVLVLDDWLAHPNTTTLAVLGKAYRRATLARALGISLTELRRFIDLFGFSPFNDLESAPSESSLTTAEAFIAAVDVVRASPFSGEELAYLLQHTTPRTPGLAPDPTIRARALSELARGLAEIDAKYSLASDSVGEDPLGQRLRDALAEVLLPENLEPAMAIVHGNSLADAAAQESRIAAQFDPEQGAPLVIFVDQAEVDDAKAKLVGGAQLTDRTKRYEYVLGKLFPVLRARAKRHRVVQQFAPHFGLPTASMLALLDHYLTDGGGDDLLHYFAETALFAGDAPTAAAKYAYERVYKSARVVSGFSFDTAELAYLYEGGVGTWLDLDTLPSGEAPVEPVTFAAWQGLYDVTRARALFPRHPATLADLRAAETKDAVIAIIAERSSWSPEDIDVVITDVHDFEPQDFDTEAAILAVAGGVTLARRLLTSAGQVREWSLLEPTGGPMGQSDSMRKALRARSDDSSWPGIAQSIQDALRVAQRNALVGYLVWKRTDVASADDLYRLFLVDVEMSPCQKTSRIRFALNSVQQFIQRVFLGLEDGLSFDEEAEAEWRWMKHYRLWEANRKVFLYPENWIDPGLRDDKSAFFSELEQALQQGDVTKEAAESAYIRYLEQLRLIARPEVVGMYREYDVVGNKVFADHLHVVARTPESPHQYFYRRRENRTTWTPWEPMPGDVQGVHILPIVYGRRLYVFWVEFRLENGETGGEALGAPHAPRKQMTARLFWVERRGDVWSSRFSAEGCVLVVEPGVIVQNGDVDETLDQPLDYLIERYRCSAQSSAEGLSISVYSRSDPQDSIRDDWSYTMLRRGGFRLSSQSGRFEIGTDTAGSEITTMQRARLPVRQEWASNGAQKPAHFWVAAPDAEKKVKEAVLFDEVEHPYRVIFEHNNHQCRVDEAGFFFRGLDHRFYVEPRLRGGIGQDATGNGVKKNGLKTPSVAKSDAVPWKEYADLPPLASAAPPVASAGIPVEVRFKSDKLSVPQKWGGALPGGKLAVSPKMVLTGQAAAAIQATQLAVDTLLGQSPTQQSQVLPGKWFDRLFNVQLFQHSYIGTFLGYIRRFGVEGLLRPLRSLDTSQIARQQRSAEVFGDGQTEYDPGADLVTDDLLNEIDFSYDGAFSSYNWELFFHAPLLVSDMLSRQGQYEEADAWLRTIFDPTASDGATVQRFWKIKPFYESADLPSIQELLLALDLESDGGSLRRRVEHQVEAWREDPFNPHLIARLRDGTYQRATVMRYLDNLIAWGDARFAQDTVESINEATQIYMLARAILGDRPAEVKKSVAVAPKTYDNLGELDAFSNALVELESKVLGTQLINKLTLANGISPSPAKGKAKPPKFWYFCVPANAQLLAYWDVVEDRLYKIRNCQDIHGVVRRLPLFDPALDPGQLVKAVASGVDLASALAQLSGRAPNYRFQTLLGKAYELVGEVKSLGAGVLAAIEKRDAEDLAALRVQHERSVLRLSRLVREAQITEADESLKAAEGALPVVQARHDYYKRLVKNGWSASERTQVNAQQAAIDAVNAATTASLIGTELGMIPNFDFGTEGTSSPVIKAQFGGQQLAAVAQMIASIYHAESSISSMASGLAGVNAGYERRAQEWQQQLDLAVHELAQVNQQIAAAQARKRVSEVELRSHDLQVANAEVVEAFMRAKYSRSELYTWMLDKLAVVYKKAYELAYRAAVAAEQAYQYELYSSEKFISFGYWDQSRSGLLAGDLLALDLRRMDAEYLDNHRREYELTKRISLAQLDPYALTQLRETGSCYVQVPEHVFDLDHPGHFLRRIRMASISLPGVTGPHVNVGCTLTLESSRIRVLPSLNVTYRETGEDDRFAYRYGKVEQVVTSSGQDSTGLFEPSLNDPRYLPFEGAGVISTWRIELPASGRQFDYRSIADAVLTLQYTAREGGSTLRAAASADVADAMEQYKNAATEEGAAVIFRASVDFSAAWTTFLYSEIPVATRDLELDLRAGRFPYLAAKAEGLKITGVRLVLVAATSQQVDDVHLEREGDQIGVDTHLVPSAPVGGLPTARWASFEEDPGLWKVKVPSDVLSASYKQVYEIEDVEYARFKDDVVRDLLVIVHYKL